MKNRLCFLLITLVFGCLAKSPIDSFGASDEDKSIFSDSVEEVDHGRSAEVSHPRPTHIHPPIGEGARPTQNGDPGPRFPFPLPPFRAVYPNLTLFDRILAGERIEKTEISVKDAIDLTSKELAKRPKMFGELKEFMDKPEFVALIKGFTRRNEHPAARAVAFKTFGHSCKRLALLGKVLHKAILEAYHFGELFRRASRKRELVLQFGKAFAHQLERVADAWIKHHPHIFPKEVIDTMGDTYDVFHDFLTYPHPLAYFKFENLLRSERVADFYLTNRTKHSWILDHARRGPFNKNDAVANLRSSEALVELNAISAIPMAFHLGYRKDGNLQFLAEEAHARYYDTLLRELEQNILYLYKSLWPGSPKRGGAQAGVEGVLE